MENLSSFSENLKDSQLELTNLDLQDNSDMYKDIIASQDMEIQRLEQQFKNSKENLDIWKNKIKQQNNSNENNVQNLGIKNQQLKEQIQDLQTENSRKDQLIYANFVRDLENMIQEMNKSGKKCRQGHTLRDVKQNDNRYQGLICDECNEYLKLRNQEGQRCNECNYDICNNCQGKKLAAECANQ
ncbi:hypothetical protein PPERSA_11542 [Pseudocohnilembus persalinus]|uniref:Phorbol-ester/DAG-type domain-containing protein n=1 Tax=Pseudocohnilembus persalinus TaxID=266149 RepID=A0A0V0QXK8_PSEPJ|nr:hypothetical protein PPERSA_11542 [Pseudocohnilembus persalinus]|eukprot:KRX06897.1 hypothetical protein PPERSA_11542 [Pseudocohnilembus persalinus]